MRHGKQPAGSLGIPVLALDGDLTSAPAAYRFLGGLLDEAEKAEQSRLRLSAPVRFCIFLRTGDVRKWRVKVCSL